MKRAALYTRVSSEEQARGRAVSLDQQWADMRALCDHREWQIVGEFEDRGNYRATQAPRKGKIVNPSGERADRPQFLAMLELVQTGQVDVVVCWRDDRLMRHPRVAVAIEDALDLGDAARKSKEEIVVSDATGGILDKFTMHIKASVWREENKRRSERMRMGKIGTLQAGRWPGSYNRFGYTSKLEEGKRGREILKGDPAEVNAIRKIFDWYDAGLPLHKIRKRLIARGVQQKGNARKRHEWSKNIIDGILRAEDYCGVATWEFHDGGISIEIPAIVDRAQWERVQKRMDNARRLSNRNAKWVYLLQNIAHCGECGGKMYSWLKRDDLKTMADGSRKRYILAYPTHHYRCQIAGHYADEPHPRPYSFQGINLDWAVWRQLVDVGIRQPELIREQVETRQRDLITEGESVDGEIAQVRSRLREIDGDRAFYQRQAARGTITEGEFDDRMAETAESRAEIEDELAEKLELRDDKNKVQAGIEYATKLLETIQSGLSLIDQSPEELRQLPRDEQREILLARQKIVRALCDTVHVFSDGRVKIEGLLDGSEATQFESVSTATGYTPP